MITSGAYFSGHRFAALAALISAPCALGTLALFNAASGGQIPVLFDGASALAIGAENGRLLTLAFWLDIFGYYLIFVPVILYIWKAIRGANEWVADLGAISGLIYCVMGAMAVATMASSFSALQALYQSGAEAAAATWTGIVAGQWFGIWQAQVIAGAVWALCFGSILMSNGVRLLGGLTFLIGLGWIVQFALMVSDMVDASQAVSNVVVLLQPVWAIWVGVALLRNSLPRFAARGIA